MLTYTGQRNLYGKLTNNDSSANLTLGDTLINGYTRTILRKLGSRALERTATDTTIASTQNYKLPNRIRKLKTVTVTSGTTKHPVTECPTRAYWEKLNEATGITAVFPEWYYIINNEIFFWPAPSTGSLTITFDYTLIQKDLSIADYTTGTIVTATNASAAITGSGTTWTTAMAGRWLRITPSDVALNNGDGEWYEITSRDSATTLTLAKKYTGVSIAAGGASYAIGEISMLPFGYHELPVFRATQIYYAKIDEARMKEFKSLADAMEADLFSDAGSDTENVVVDDPEDEERINPNLMVTL